MVSCFKLSLFLNQQLLFSMHKGALERHNGRVGTSAPGGVKGARPVFTHLQLFKVS